MVRTGIDADQLLERAAAGDAEAWGALLAEHEPRLRRIVAFRLDPRLNGRIDAGDVVQEVFVEATSHRVDYVRKATSTALPLFLWLRGIVSNKLLELHRHHLGTRMRDAARDRALHRPAAASNADATSDALVAQLTGGATGPGTLAERAETARRLRDALEQMEPTDREVLALRHYEQLDNAEVAQVLGIERKAASKRYLRALKRLKEVLAEMPGGLTGLGP